MWEKKLPMQVSRGNYGSGSSPVLCGDFVVQALDTDEGGSHLLALKRTTGETAWDIPRPLFMAGWSTPVVWPGTGIEKGKDQLIVLGSKKLTAYDSADGKELWSVAGFPNEPAPSPAFDEKQLYVCSAGMGGRANPEFGGVRWSDVQQFDADKDGQVRLDHVPADAPFVLRPELPPGHPGRDFPVPLSAILKSLDTNKSGIVTKAEWDSTMAAFESMDKPLLMALRHEATTDDQRISWQISRGIPWKFPHRSAILENFSWSETAGLLQCFNAPNPGTYGFTRNASGWLAGTLHLPSERTAEFTWPLNREQSQWLMPTPTNWRSWRKTPLAKKSQPHQHWSRTKSMCAPTNTYSPSEAPPIDLW